MVSRSLIVIITLMVITFRSAGQECWLQPNKVRYKTGDSLKVMFTTGENFNGHRWQLPKDNIEKLQLYQGNSVLDLKPYLMEEAKFPLAVPSQGGGTKLVVLQTKDTLIQQEAQKFTVSLKEDGLEDVIAQRAKTGTTNTPAKEIVSYHTKLLVQAGSEHDDVFKNAVGFPVEIIPDKNPALLKKGDVLHFKILYEGKPLFGAKVRIWNYFDHLTTTQNIYTQQDGTIEMTISGPGSWLVNVVKMTPSKNGTADWQSYRSSLVFGVK